MRFTPSKKFTVPSGATPPPPGVEMVAVNVTEVFSADGFAVDVSVTAVDSCTTCENGVEVLPKWSWSFPSSL